MIEVLVTLLALVIVLGLCWWLVSMLPLDARLKQIAQVIFIVIALLIVFGVFFGGVPLVPLRR